MDERFEKRSRNDLINLLESIEGLPTIEGIVDEMGGYEGEIEKVLEEMEEEGLVLRVRTGKKDVWLKSEGEKHRALEDIGINLE